MSDAEKRMQELVRLLKETSYAYYVLDNPVISDMQWDRMYDELKKLEAETGIVLEDSPTTKVGGDPLKGFEEHRHITRLWSMDKVQSMEELDAWILRTEKLAEKANLQYYLEYKFDGLTLNLTYRDGELVQAATRGNGIVGEAILPQAKTDVLPTKDSKANVISVAYPTGLFLNDKPTTLEDIASAPKPTAAKSAAGATVGR